MKLNWRCLITLVSGMVFVQGSVLAIDCDETTREAREETGDDDMTYSRSVVVGVIHDARSHGIAEGTLENLSKDDSYHLFASSKWGPYLIVIEDWTNRIFPFYVRDAEKFEEGVQRMASVIGRRVRVTGCLLAGGSWPALHVDNLNDIELLP